MIIRNPIITGLDKFIARHPIDDKLALRLKIKELVGDPKPEKWLMQMVDDKLFILAANEVLFFRPDQVM